MFFILPKKILLYVAEPNPLKNADSDLVSASEYNLVETCRTLTGLYHRSSNLKCGTNVISPPVAVYGFWDWVGPILENILEHFPIDIFVLVLPKGGQSSPRIRSQRQGGRYVPHLRL